MANPASPLDGARQLLVVTADDWQSTSGRLQRHERARDGDAWRPVGPAIDVSLGRAGLAWGRGLHPAQPVPPAPKGEGDGKAPAGVFAITALFGDAPDDSPFARAARLPYHGNGAHLKCVDDPASQHYNRIVDLRTLAAPDWQSHEEMQRPDQRYAVGAVIAHNPDCLAGAGSCIFLHVWQAPGVPTAGCTAGALDDITALCQWLDGAARPLLVQLPGAEYARLQAAWALP